MNVNKYFEPPAEFESWLFLVMALFALGTIWLPERPPMVDLPQHIAQLNQWRDLLAGRSPWTNIVETNYATPYILTYVLMLPFADIFGATAAAKLLLSFSFVSFVGLCIVLRRELGGDSKLDWLFLFGFFGFAWRFGFLPFLVAAPLVVLFLIASFRSMRSAGRGDQLIVFLVGALLLITHGLQFMFAVTIGGLAILLDESKLSFKLRAYAPYYILAALMLGLWWAMRSSDNFAAGGLIFDNPFFNRAKVPLYILGNDRADWWGVLATIVAFAVPLTCGFRPGRRHSWLPFAVCLAVVLFAPYLWHAAFVYQRFALFLLPFWAVAFTKNKETQLAPISLDHTRRAALVLATIGALAIHTGRQFPSEDRTQFETILAAAEPNKRALSITYKANDTASAYPIYRNYATWYAVDKGGFVDFSFAYYFNSIIRFRTDKIPALSARQSFFTPDTDLSDDLPLYDYLFIHGTSQDVDRMMSVNKKCIYHLKAADGSWWLFEKSTCAS